MAPITIRTGFLLGLLILAWWCFSHREEARPIRREATMHSAQTVGRRPVVKTAETRRETEASDPRSQWRRLIADVTNVDAIDQAALDLLYRRAENLIHSNEESINAELSASLSELFEERFEKSFFVISAMIRYSHSPELIVKKVMGYEPDDRSKGGGHGEALTPLEKSARVKAYTLRELRERIEQNVLALPDEARREIVQELTPAAETEKSLDLSIETFQLINELGDRDTAQRLLQKRTDRDRRLISAVIY